MKLQFLHQEGLAAAAAYEAERNRRNEDLESQVNTCRQAHGSAGDNVCINVRRALSHLEEHFAQKIDEASKRRDEFGFADYQLYNFAYSELREQVLTLQLEALMELEATGGHA